MELFQDYTLFGVKCLWKIACANDNLGCTKTQYQYRMEEMAKTILYVYGKLILVQDVYRALWMKGICLIWSRGWHISPSLPDRGPTGIRNLAHSVSDPRAEISGILVMVRRSSSTSRDTTYWFLYFYFLYSGYFGLRVRKSFQLKCLP